MAYGPLASYCSFGTNYQINSNKMEISQALEALSFLSGEEKEVGRTRVGVGLSDAIFFRSSCGSGNGGNGPLELCLLVYDSVAVRLIFTIPSGND